ncbi:hypothetical protein B0T25DRAFT_276767 [Lasiosphaeria hispida]|uniref:Uncharacterized protein n=1 Tax=Lasiosphaeria hispida TaxID=260671 RepID=A0AAJ0HB27_9PEZI|nr:hypothetical protein B0T25DRAFT_276767 [Lasiosphaeria hispida]
MRSHPYTPPPPLPPLLDDLADELASILPNQTPGPRRASDTSEIELGQLDPDTSRLLPVRPKRHHVRVQGRLVLVRSISTANLRHPSSPSTLTVNRAVSASRRGSSGSPPLNRAGSGGSGPKTPTGSAAPGAGYESALGSAPAARGRKPRGRRRWSLDDGAVEEDGSETETEEEARDTVIRDRQLRGYGIGGAGNIRRPTDVAHFSSKRSSMMLLSGVLPSSAPTTPTSPTAPDRRRWNIREMFGLADRKGKGKITAL